MNIQTAVVMVRQAGSAAGIVPAMEDFIDMETGCNVDLIAFPQAIPTCREVLGTKEQLLLHCVRDEGDAKNFFLSKIANAAFFLSGTSSEAEADAFYWRSARAHGVPSIAYLDQYSNIEKRFPGVTPGDWPDSLAVIDEHDKALASRIAPSGVRIVVIGSPALERTKARYQELRSQGIVSEPDRIVFATEPVENPEEFRAINGFTDEDSFEFVKEMIRRKHPGSRLVVRLHPRDSKERWRGSIPDDFPVEWDYDTRALCLARAARVFGMRSFFLREAAECGVPVVSVQPQRRTECPLTDGRMQVVTRLDDYLP
jgi:hypothetical protein